MDNQNDGSPRAGVYPGAGRSQISRPHATQARVAVSVSASVIGVLVMFVLGNGSAVAHQQGNKLHLGDAPPDQQVEGISYCDGIYRVITKEGSPVEYPEFDLRFKTDASPDGPPPGTPVVINAGMKGDRGFVIFSAPSEIGAFIKTKC